MRVISLKRRRPSILCVSIYSALALTLCLLYFSTLSQDGIHIALDTRPSTHYPPLLLMDHSNEPMIPASEITNLQELPSRLNLNPISDKNAEDASQSMQDVYSEKIQLPWCPLLAQHYERYKYLRNSDTRYFVALNLYNSEKIIPNMAVQLVKLATFLGIDRLFISIYENGSNDNTGIALDIFRDTLEELGVANEINVVYSQAINWTTVRRVEQLAILRNLAMGPMFANDTKDVYDSVVFINDVVFCASDVLELLYNKHIQKADIACGLDYVWMNALNDHIFYDNWVTRDLSGSRLWTNVFRWRYEMLSSDTISRTRWEKGVPFQVWSCWNGLAILDAKPFYEGVRFRQHKESECASSECSLIAKDFWSLGYGRVMIIPSVKITYWPQAHEKVHHDFPPFATINPDFDEVGNQNNAKSWVQAVWSRDEEESKIKWRKGPESVICLPLDGVGTHYADEKHPIWEPVPNHSAPLIERLS